jgi:hypothetical protein
MFYPVTLPVAGRGSKAINDIPRAEVIYLCHLMSVRNPSFYYFFKTAIGSRRRGARRCCRWTDAASLAMLMLIETNLNLQLCSLFIFCVSHYGIALTFYIKIIVKHYRWALSRSQHGAYLLTYEYWVLNSAASTALVNKVITLNIYVHRPVTRSSQHVRLPWAPRARWSWNWTPTSIS